MRTLIKLSFLVLVLPVLTACPVKNRPRVEHESRRDWTPSQTPIDDTVETKSFNEFNVRAAYDAIRDGKGDLINRVLKPLSRFVLNGNFIERPEFRTLRLKQMVEIFNSAMLERMMAKDNSPDFRELKLKYKQTVFAGCSRDLKSDCYNGELFSQDTRHTRLMTLLAMEFDPLIEQAVKTAKTTLLCVTNDVNCRELVENRYRLLAMALYKRNRYDDPDFAFAYLKHARIFGELVQVMRGLPPGEIGNMSTSYLAETHAKIFETIIPKFKPRNENDPEFRQFVENFNPWGFSRKKSDIFQYGTGIMFKFAANCCMYKDAARNQLSDTMEKTLRDEQNNPNALSPSLYTMIKAIEKEHGNKLFANLRISDIAAQALKIDQPNLAFYNEYFFVVDRLFRGDLNSEEVEMVLRRTNQQRLKTALPAMISAYIKIQLAYMIVETNKFMRDEIYTSGVRADKVFEKALTSSRALTSRWHDMQGQISQLERLMGSYFKTNFIDSKEYRETDKLIKSVNRNIHYMSVYPQMMILNYYLASMDGKLTFDTWWGRVEIDSSTIIGNFFDGNTVNPWFRFGTDPETLNRHMLLFSFEYLLSTESLKYFVNDGATNRAKFFDMIIGKYFDIELAQLNSYISDYERDIHSQENSAALEETCRYELNEPGANPPSVELNFLELHKFTYSGLGDMGIRKSLMKILTGTNSSTSMLRGTIESRTLFIRVMLDILNADLKRRNVYKDDHEDTRRIREGLATMEAMKLRLAKLFLANHQRYFDCAFALDQVERRRANRLYEEERAHLAEIYNMMLPLKNLEGEPLARAAAALTAELRKKGYRFDLIDRHTYKMSKFDLFRRIKDRIQRDVFQVPTQREKEVYGADVNKYTKPRPVRINEPANVERDEITGAETSVQVIMRSTPEDFIAQGMSVFNGKTGAFIDWSSQLQRDPQLDRALAPMIEFYLIGPVRDGNRTLEIKKEELSRAYLRVLSASAMDDFDLINAAQFGNEGVQVKAYFQGKLFEADFRTRLPLFYDLARKVSGSAELLFDSRYKLSETLEFARTYNTLQPFVFEPEQILVPEETQAGKPPALVPKHQVTESVKAVYGDRMHFLFNRVSDLLRYFDAEQKRVDNKPGELDKNFLRPFFIDNGRPVAWFDPRSIPVNMSLVADEQKKKDVKDILSDFVSRSGDFFKTSKKVQAP